MALFRPSSVVQAVSGQLGGCVFVAGSKGSYVRRAAVKVDQATPVQLRARKGFQDGVSAWPTLTENQRKGWATLAARIYRVDRLGVQKPYTARGLFLSQAAITGRVRLPTVLDAPGLGVRQAFAAVSVSMTSSAFTVSFTKFSGQPSGWIITYAARSFSQGGFSSKDLVIIDARAFSSSATVNLTTQFDDRFGKPEAGEYYAVGLLARFDGCLWSSRWETTARRS